MKKEITDQASYIKLSGFWESPIGKKWLKENQEMMEKISKEKKPKAVGMLLPTDNCITRLIFKDEKRVAK